MPLNKYEFLINICMKLEEAERFLEQGKNIEAFVEKIDWKDFEKFVREIFSANGFVTFRDFRFKTDRRFEIDVVATKNNLILLADCKEWNKGRYKNSGLKKAAEGQILRAKEFKKFIRKNPIAKHKMKIDADAKVLPLVVTWYEETVSEYQNCFVVPVWKLNSFLIGYDFY